MRLPSIIVLLFFLAVAIRADVPPLWETTFFTFYAPEELADSADFYRLELEATRQQAARNWSVALNAPVNVYLWPRESWDNLVQHDPSKVDILAYVTDAGHTMVINHAGCLRAGPDGFRPTLIHEYTHAYIQQMIERWPDDIEYRHLPRWLEEGICMAAAHQIRWADNMKLRWMGPRRMIPLMQLAMDFPSNSVLQRQAYRQSASVIEVLLGEEGDVKSLIDEIIDPNTGPSYLAASWRAESVAGLEHRWHATLRIGWRWMMIFTSAGFAWAVVIVLAVFAWKRRRKLARQKVYRWAMEAEGLIVEGANDEEQSEDIDHLLRGE